MNTRSIDINLSDQFCADVMCTALEGGIGYWCVADKIKRAPRSALFDYVSFEACDAEAEGDFNPDITAAFQPTLVTYDTIRDGIQRILNGSVKIRSDLREQVLGNVLDEDDVMDADAADCVVQAGLFNEVRYG